MNRTAARGPASCASVPHGRGDEPGELRDDSQIPDVFPTGVGMNRKDDDEPT